MKRTPDPERMARMIREAGLAPVSDQHGEDLFAVSGKRRGRKKS